MRPVALTGRCACLRLCLALYVSRVRSIDVFGRWPVSLSGTSEALDGGASLVASDKTRLQSAVVQNECTSAVELEAGSLLARV